MTIRVLAVDDDAASRELLEAALSAHGWDVTIAEDGVAALEAARETPPDIILSDILMPTMDGYRLCQEWRADETLCPIPFVFYTATYTEPEDEEFALSLGADDFILKPIENKELIARIEPIVHLQVDDSVRRRRCEKRPDGASTAHGSGPASAWGDSIELTREIVDISPVGIIVIDVEGRVVRRNRSAEFLLGLEKGEAFDDLRAGLAHSDDPDRYREALMRVFSSGAMLPLEMHCTLRGDAPKTLRVVGEPLRDHVSRDTLGALFVISDVTECRDLEAKLADRKDRLEHLMEERTQELTLANARLRETAQAKGAFVAGMGHEMKNQLNSIIGFSGILQQGLAGPLSDEQLLQVDMVYAAGQALLSLVDDVVNLSKLEAGQTKVHVAPFELLGLLEGIIASFEMTTQEKKISVEFLAPSGVIPMHSDSAKIEQIVRSLFSNAIKFAPGGRVFVEVERDDSGESVIMRVTDTGEGIAPEVITHIFDEFVKYERGGSSETSGTGLGLTISHKLSEMLGGNISARSHPGEGSVFTVILPVDLREDTSGDSV